MKDSKIREKELEDNLWFVSEIEWKDINSVVLVGSDNWKVATELILKHRGIDCIIYESNKEAAIKSINAINEVLKNDAKLRRHIIVTNDFRAISNKIANKRSLILFADSLHKLYSYSSKESIDRLIEQLVEIKFRYIAIRDTYILKDRGNTISDYEVLDKIFKAANKDFELDENLEEFQGNKKNGGSIAVLNNLLHFLLKYWRFDLNEDYLSLDIDEFVGKLNGIYDIKIKRRYYMPCIHRRWKEDFDIDLKENTHIKVLLESSE